MINRVSSISNNNEPLFDEDEDLTGTPLSSEAESNTELNEILFSQDDPFSKQKFFKPPPEKNVNAKRTIQYSREYRQEEEEEAEPEDSLA